MLCAPQNGLQGARTPRPPDAHDDTTTWRRCCGPRCTDVAPVLTRDTRRRWIVVASRLGVAETASGRPTAARARSHVRGSRLDAVHPKRHGHATPSVLVEVHRLGLLARHGVVHWNISRTTRITKAVFFLEWGVVIGGCRNCIGFNYLDFLSIWNIDDSEFQLWF